jgi:hypothetical protein
VVEAHGDAGTGELVVELLLEALGGQVGGGHLSESSTSRGRDGTLFLLVDRSRPGIRGAEADRTHGGAAAAAPRSSRRARCRSW